jgi:hypothetical protein
MEVSIVQTDQMSMAVLQMVASTLIVVKKLNLHADLASSVFTIHGFVMETVTVQMPVMNHIVRINSIFIFRLFTVWILQ